MPSSTSSRGSADLMRYNEKAIVWLHVINVQMKWLLTIPPGRLESSSVANIGFSSRQTPAWGVSRACVC